MTAPVLLLSDLHLPPGPSPLRDSFLAFLRGPARGASAVYILGDLFEYWVGDDAGADVYAAEWAALRELTSGGVQVFFQHGNRDFMVGRDFFRETGVQKLPDPHRLELAGTPTLLSHGDLWCTDDRPYQRWRWFSRLALAQWWYLAHSRDWRENFGKGLRKHSDGKKPAMAAYIMDVNAGAIAAAFRKHGVSRVIHGHTHRPAEHREAGGERIVLADWRPDRREYLKVDASGFQRVALPG